MIEAAFFCFNTHIRIELFWSNKKRDHLDVETASSKYNFELLV